MVRLYRQVTRHHSSQNEKTTALNRRPALLLQTLLFLDGPRRLRHGLEPAPGYGLPALIGEPVGTLFYLPQRPVDLPEAALGLLPNGGVHLAGKHILAQVAGVERGVPLGLAEVFLVGGHAFSYAHQFVAQAQ